jgi:hypothetical protein
MKTSRLLLTFLAIGLALIAFTSMLQPGMVGVRSAYAQPASLDPGDDSTIPPPKQEPDLLITEPDPAENNSLIVPQETSVFVWFKLAPDGVEWLVGLGVLLVLWGLVFLLYRLMLPGQVTKLRHPANLRALMLMLGGFLFLVWCWAWFFYYLDAFGWLSGGVLLVMGLVLVIAGLVSRK